MLVRLVVRTALAAMLVGTVPAATALPVVANEVNAKQIGPVEIQGDSGDFRIVVDGETLLRDADSMFVGIDRVYPDEANPRWLLISLGTGGNACEPEYRMVDLTRSPPTLSAPFGNCGVMQDIEGRDQVVFSFYADPVPDLWIFDGNGLMPVPKRTLDEHVRTGVDAYKAGDYATALRHLWPFTDRQQPEAAFHMGLMAHLGKEVGQDYKAAMAYYRQAADLEYAEAFFRIGVLHANGRGVAKDPAEAARWYRKAAERGNSLGMFNLGLVRMTGSGAAKDLNDALYWFLLAEPRLAEPGDREIARRNIAFIEGKLSVGEMRAVQVKAAAWAPVEPRMFASASDLRMWVGKHPMDRVKGRSLLDVPELNARLRVLLGEERLSALGAMAVSSPVTESDGWILAAGCMPHNCGSEHYAVAVDTRSYDVLACVVRSRTGGPGSDVVWTGTNRRTVERTVEDAEEVCTWKTGSGDIKAVLD